jgi:mannose/fructose/sorbose-specific phosphotransferase system IIA component
MIDLIILTHWSLSKALLETVEKILGKQKGVTTLSSKSLSPVDLYKNVEASVTNSVLKGNDVLILVDLKGGNTWNIACKLAHSNENIRIVSGVNLGMVISFFTKQQNNSLDSLVSVLIEDGNRHIDKFPQDK